VSIPVTKTTVDPTDLVDGVLCARGDARATHTASDTDRASLETLAGVTIVVLPTALAAEHSVSAGGQRRGAAAILGE